MKKIKTYNGKNFKNWYCKVDVKGNAICSKQFFIGTLGGFINLVHKSDLDRTCYKFDTFKLITLLDLSTIEKIVKEQAYCLADSQLSKIPPRMQINEYWNKNIELIKKSNIEIFTIDNN
jgi:hypothetical protein